MAFNKRLPLFSGILNNSKKIKIDENDSVCAICKTSVVIKKDFGLILSQGNWNTLAQKCLDWKNLGENEFSHLYEVIKENEIPAPIHKLCRLNVIGHRLSKAKKAFQARKTTEAETKSLLQQKNCFDKQDRNFLDNRRQLRSESHLKDICIICEENSLSKYVSKLKVTENLSKMESQECFLSLKKALEIDNDENRKNRIDSKLINFPKSIVYYHRTCFKSYVYSPKIINVNGLASERMERIQWVQNQKKEAFLKLCSFIEDHIDKKREVYTLCDLLFEYEQIQLEMHICSDEIRENSDSHYEIKLLREKLQSYFGDKIGFQSRYRKNESSIVYFTKHGGAYVESAVNCSNLTPNLIANVSKSLHKLHKNADAIPWPSEVLNLQENTTPNDIHNLVAFLANPEFQMVDGRAVVSNSMEPSVRFISEALMALITKKRQPLLVSLSIGIHNITGSKEIVKILKKFGIGISYNDVIDQISAWALHEHKSSLLTNVNNQIFNCPKEIASGFPSTVIMDNDDFRESGLTGGETSHYTNVIMAQPACLSNKYLNRNSSSKLEIPSASDKKCLVIANVAKTYKNATRFNPTAKSLPISITEEPMYRATAHALLRYISPKFTVPSFTGYHCSLFGYIEKWETFNVKCFPQPPSKEVVLEVMDWCQNVAETKEIPIIQLVSDQAVYKYIEEALFEDEARWDRVKGVLGPFHTEFSYLNALGKRYSGSGIEDLAVVSGLLAEGSVQRALSGKHYYRGMRSYKLLAEVLIKMLIDCFIDKNPEILHQFQHLPEILTEKEHDEFVQSSVFQNFVSEMFNYVTTSDSEMAHFWLSFILDVELLIQHYHYLRRGNNFNNFLQVSLEMIPLLAAYGNINYVRYLSIYYWRMSTLSTDDKVHMSQIYSFSLSGNNYSNMAPDQVIEMTINKQSKNRRGSCWIGITKNMPMININMLSRPIVMYLREQLFSIADNKSPACKHPELGPSRMKKDYDVVANCEMALNEWGTNPWDLSNPILRSLQSGRPASTIVKSSLLTAHEEGKRMANSVMSRLTSGTQSIHDPIKKLKVYTFSTKEKSKISIKENRKEIDHSSIKKLINVLTSGKDKTMTLETIMNYRITSVSLALFTSEEMFHKPVKSKFTSVMKLVSTTVTDYHAIVDMGMIWNKVSPGKSWSEFALELFHYILRRHPHARTVHIINDVYNEDALKKSPKFYEQNRRQLAYGFVPNVYPLGYQKMPTGLNWRAFLSNASNKERLQTFLLKEWCSYSFDSSQPECFYTLNNSSYNLKTGLTNSQYYGENIIEADSRAFYIADKIPDNKAIVLDFEDTDVWVIGAYMSFLFTKEIYMHKKVAGSASNFYMCKTFFKTHDIANAALGIYTYTGVDTVNGFYGCGKVKIFKKILEENNIQHFFTMTKLGEGTHVTNDYIHELEMFCINIIYNDKISSTLSQARALKWTKLTRHETSRLPPDSDSLLQHSKRAYLQTYEWKNCHKGKKLNMFNFGWKLSQEPIMHTKEALPDCIYFQPPETSSELSNSDSSDCDSDSSDSGSDSSRED